METSTALIPLVRLLARIAAAEAVAAESMPAGETGASSSPNKDLEHDDA